MTPSLRILCLSVLLVSTSSLTFADEFLPISKDDLDRLVRTYGLSPRENLPRFVDVQAIPAITRNATVGAPAFTYAYKLRLSEKNQGYAVAFAVQGRSSSKIIEKPGTWIGVEGKPFLGHARWIGGDRGKTSPVLLPGNEMGGFALQSEGIPTIVEFEASPGTDEENFYPDIDDPGLTDTEVKQLVELQRIDSLNEDFRGKTIGPGQVPPTDQRVIRDTFIVDLIGQVREAVAAGWIKHDLRKDRDDDDDHGKGNGDEKVKKKSSSAKATEDRGHDKDDDEDDDDMDDADKKLPGVAKAIIKKLTKVRRECLRGRFGSAREKLRALIKQVNAQRGRHLTEEAYALIKFNAEFLLEKI